MTLTPSQIEKLKPEDRELAELCEKATPGEWTASPVSSVVGSLIYSGIQNNVAAAMPRKDKRECEANSQLIAAARTALPRLLERQAELLERNKNLNRWHSEIEVREKLVYANAPEDIRKGLARLKVLNWDDDGTPVEVTFDEAWHLGYRRGMAQAAIAEMKFKAAEEHSARLEAALREIKQIAWWGHNIHHAFGEIEDKAETALGLSPADRETPGKV